jgi:hypothetical protein
LYYSGKPFDFDAIQVFSTNLRAKDSSGLGLYDDGNNLGVFINDSGNVGIGTSTPQNELNVIGDGNFTGNITIEEIHLEKDSINHRIYDNSTCVIIEGDTSTMYIC